MTAKNKRNEFLTALEQSLANNALVKLTLGDYDGLDGQLRNIYVRPVLVKRIPHLGFTYRYKTRDVAKNYAFDEGLSHIRKALGHDFHMAHLVTTKYELTLQHNALKKTTIAPKGPVSMDHNREKNRVVGNGNRPYLHALGLTDASGKVLNTAQDKFRQIDKYIEIVGGLINDLPQKKSLKIVDMGAGKGYLTLALHDYLATKSIAADITGVEYRDDLVASINGIIKDLGLKDIRFVQGTIESYHADHINLLIALHACNTATDDAIGKGIKAGADLIVVSPCCHKQIRQEMKDGKARNELEFLTRHGIFMERQAEMVTDGLRAMILEYFGYKTKVFEFISDAHTAKNTMIVGVKGTISKRVQGTLLDKIKTTKAFFGIHTHHLEQVMEI